MKKVTIAPPPLRNLTSKCAFGDAIHPEGVIGPFLPITADDVDTFNDLLSDEVDSAFTSSLCCCDCCYDDFRSHWPHVTFREMEFQKQSMSSTWLVDHSRLPDVYTPAEISTLRWLVTCPRCLAKGPTNVWAYEHKFSDVKEIEKSIDELLALGDRTPFLLLEHAFSRQVLATIRTLAGEVEKTNLEYPVYRARLTDSAHKHRQSPSELTTYAAPPAHVVEEGRFNHAGRPLLYLASSLTTAVAEITSGSKACYVGKLRLLQPLRILDLVDVEDAQPGHEIIEAMAHSALVSAPRTGVGWIKRQYIFSRFVADCAIAAGFDAIRYGSTKEADGWNYVLLNVPEDFAVHVTLEGYDETPPTA